jgi:hypothetical protein
MLEFSPSHCKLVLSSIPIHNNPVGLSLETWLANGADLNVRSIAQGNRSGNLYMELLVKPEILTSYIYTDVRLATLKAVSFYLLRNVSTLNQCRNFFCVIVVSKLFGSYQNYPNDKWDLIQRTCVLFQSVYVCLPACTSDRPSICLCVCVSVCLVSGSEDRLFNGRLLRLCLTSILAQPSVLYLICSIPLCVYI